MSIGYIPIRPYQSLSYQMLGVLTTFNAPHPQPLAHLPIQNTMGYLPLQILNIYRKLAAFPHV